MSECVCMCMCKCVRLHPYIYVWPRATAITLCNSKEKLMRNVYCIGVHACCCELEGEIYLHNDEVPQKTQEEHTERIQGQ
jgi:hypothetical protein